MSDYIEISFRWIFGLQMIFWGLNGFFHFVKIPPSNPTIDAFVTSCNETKFIMPTVKFLEVLFGIFLILNFAVTMSLAVFAPILFVVTGLHVFHNPRPWGILGSFTLPYCLLVLFHAESLLRLVH